MQVSGAYWQCGHTILSMNQTWIATHMSYSPLSLFGDFHAPKESLATYIPYMGLGWLYSQMTLKHNRLHALLGPYGTNVYDGSACSHSHAQVELRRMDALAIATSQQQTHCCVSLLPRCLQHCTLMQVFSLPSQCQWVDMDVPQRCGSCTSAGADTWKYHQHCKTVTATSAGAFITHGGSNCIAFCGAQELHTVLGTLQRHRKCQVKRTWLGAQAFCLCLPSSEISSEIRFAPEVALKYHTIR